MRYPGLLALIIGSIALSVCVEMFIIEITIKDMIFGVNSGIKKIQVQGIC